MITLNKETSSVYLYYVNSRDNIESCIQSYSIGDLKLYTAIEDGYWAGSGMYFWDNLGNANYWLKKSKKKNPVILRARLTFSNDELLDLSDNFVLDKFNNLWPVVAKRLKISKNATLGKKINQIVKIYDGDIKVVKEIGYYPKRILENNNHIRTTSKEHDFLNVSNKYAYPHVTSKVKTIYCVKEPSVLSELEVIGE